LDPVRVAAGPFVLWAAADGSDALITRPDGTIVQRVPGATDIAAGADGTVLVARGPGRSLLRYAPDGTGWAELEPLDAPGFDGAAIAVAPDGRVAFTAGRDIGWTAGSAARHLRDGTVVTYRLDSGAYRSRWGRIFLDACLPPHTSLGLRFVTSDDADVPDPVAPSAPDRGRRPVPDPDATPPLASRSALDTAGPAMPVFRRPNGRELPWEQIAADDDFETYEAPVSAAAGRFLWIELTLHGTAKVTPRVRALRVERPGHQLLRALPKAWSRGEAEAEFLQRFLAPSEGLLHELDLRAATRAVLVDPYATPAEALNWLAGFAGLVLDGRWPERARRDLVAQAYPLFRRRGTKAALIQLVRIYLGYPPVVVESWQLRGLGGAVLGLTPDGPAAPSVGGSARATGTLGRFMVGGQAAGQTSFTGTAHRFCVLVPGNLTGEQREVIRGILDRHRPAHTVYELLELGPGMRVGDRLRVRLTSFIGPGARPDPAVVGESVVGSGAVVGRAVIGSRVGAATVGEVRVG
jgi:phage tail-like protein